MSNDGYIIHFDEEQRKELILDTKIDEGSFSDALSVHDWKIRDIQVALLSFDGKTIDYISLATRGNRVATAKYRVEFSELVNLDSLLIEDIEKELDSIEKLKFMKSSSGIGGKISPKNWENVIDTIKKLREKQSEDIERLLSLKTYSNFTFEGNISELFSQEREALGIALDVFSGSNKLRKKVLKGWAPNESNIKKEDNKENIAKLEVNDENEKSFLSSISGKYKKDDKFDIEDEIFKDDIHLIEKLDTKKNIDENKEETNLLNFIDEESAIQHDRNNWDGKSIKEHILNRSTFIQGDRELNVIYANRNALEKTLGVDLIYYNLEFDSYVLVQYKLMKEEKTKGEFIYRPDKQLIKEIKRMNDFRKKYKYNLDISAHSELRLNDDGFLFKMVPNRGLKVASDELIKGMYITREYMNFLLGSKGPKGKKDGQIISFDNSPRYLSNSEFSNMVNKGWIGTRRVNSIILSDLINEFSKTGKAVLIAIEDIKKETKNANT
ncbi:hypothetical protein CRV00_01575 [Malaciobacter molluscorum]|uniref:hypothetical protein n=1 Tax=Malaciobacter molluscorum TaxID=1032072 RepID=UPI00100B64E2|nr:hypothetical protein [Malaciobacter molluscorum]RXJ96334.1 hypothetical protein CRV00_01575 [Malaciobacter molluscorum]